MSYTASERHYLRDPGLGNVSIAWLIVRTGDRGLVTDALDRGVDINSLEPERGSLLHAAVQVHDMNPYADFKYPSYLKYAQRGDCTHETHEIVKDLLERGKNSYNCEGIFG